MRRRYQRKRELDVAGGRRSLAAGVGTGGRRLLEGVAGGVAGLVMQPLQGSREGAYGFIKVREGFLDAWNELFRLSSRRRALDAAS